MPSLPAELKCIFFPDLSRWERSYFDALVNGLSQWHRIEKVDVWESERKWKDSQPTPNYWVLSHDWKAALRSLQLPGTGKVSVSALGWKPETGSLLKILWRRSKPSYFNRLQLLTHSPLNQRFYSEIEGLKAPKLNFLPLPLLAKTPAPLMRPQNKRLVVGTLAPFSSENNLNYFLSVAHYVVQKRQDVLFRIAGAGPLYPHLSRMIQELHLENHVEVAEISGVDELNDFDAFLYVPLRNDHFLPMLEMANRQVPVIASEIPGVQELLTDSKSGFIVPTHEIKPMGELVLRLLDSEVLRTALGREFLSEMEKKFSLENLRPQFESALFHNSKHRLERTPVSHAA